MSSSKDHHKVVTVAVWTAVAAVVIGGMYWWQVRTQEQVTHVDASSQTQAELLAVIRGSPVEVTPEDIARSLEVLRSRLNTK